MDRDKHPRLARWTHWLNVPLLGLMAWSGLRIYWANDVYLKLPERFYARLGLDYHLADGMAVHFFVGWLFALNGLAYVLYNAFSGEWRRTLSPRGPYNLGQRLLYPAAVAMGAGLVLTGLAIYKPAQLAPLTRLLGGYRLARREHFFLMLGLLGFAALHVAKVAEAGWLNLRSMIAGLPDEASGPAARQVTRRALLAGGAAQVLRLSDVKALPRVALTTDLNCIEGWSDRNTFAGARFSDFMDRYALPRARHVGLETPGRGYYVSLDLETMLHPQTLLVYEMNGEPLSDDHGAPLRLFTPLNYGIKSLKRIGRIVFSDRRPPDYWEERGYDWWAGL